MVTATVCNIIFHTVSQPIGLLDLFISSSLSHPSQFVIFTDRKPCTIQYISQWSLEKEFNTMSRIPAAVASFLQLPDASSYCGHSMKRTSATLLANAGGDLMTIKRLGGWKSSNVAESYIDNSLSNKLKTAEMIQKETAKQVAMNHTGETSCESSIPATVEVNLSSPIKQKKDNNVLYISVNIDVNLNK